MAKEITTELCGEALTLYADKAILWQSQRTLIVSDLHWGKAEIFQQHGIPVSSEVLDADLEVLGQLLETSEAERLLVLGDLFHGLRGLTDDLVEKVSAWRKRYPQTFVSLRGNHDRGFKDLPADWALTWVDGDLREGPFSFAHEPGPEAGHYTLSGHIHPVVTIRGLGRLPCFSFGERQGLLPSFSLFTGGHAIHPAPSERVYALAEGEILPLH